MPCLVLQWRNEGYNLGNRCSAAFRGAHTLRVRRADYAFTSRLPIVRRSLRIAVRFRSSHFDCTLRIAHAQRGQSTFVNRLRRRSVSGGAPASHHHRHSCARARSLAMARPH